jgi:hypothetical protein
MMHRFLLSVGLATLGMIVVSLAVVPASAQTAPDFTVARTPWGDPDLQGTYTSDDYIGTRLERNPELGDRLFLTNEEISERDNQIESRATRDSVEFTDPEGRVGTGPPGHWGERGRRPPTQTSLLIDPPDGRLPTLTALGEERSDWARLNRQGAGSDRPTASWEDYTYYIRCITRGPAGSILPVIYGNGTRIVQSPGYVAIQYEMVHEAKIIPLDGKPHVGEDIKSYMGDSVGWWEGDTLVVHTTNIFDLGTGLGGNGGGTPLSDAARMTERFTRTGADTIQYEVTVDAPKTYARPFTASFPIREEPDYEVFEYACHEGNYGMVNQLSASRAVDRGEATANDVD